MTQTIHRRARRRAPPLHRRVIFAAITTVAALLLMELGARLVDLQGPRWLGAAQRAELMVSHPTRLWALGPGSHRTAQAQATINALGLRGPTPASPRPAGRERALLLGDSTFFGHGVGDASTMGVMTERALQAGGLDAEVINASVPGYSSEQGRRLLNEQGWALEPTLLLVGYLWSDNNVDGFKDADLMATRALLDRGALSQSRAFLLLATLLSKLRTGQGPRIVSWTSTSHFPDYGTRRVPLRRFAKNLDAIARAAAERGVSVAFIAPANRNMLTQSSAPEVGWGPYFAAQAAVAAHHGLPVLSLQPALQQLYEKSDLDATFLDYMHPTAAGNAAAGEAIAAGLRAAGWPERPLLAAGDGPFSPVGLRDVPTDDSPLPADHRSLQVQLFGGTGAPDPTIARPVSGGSLTEPAPVR